MARILKGSEVAQAINERTARQVEALHAAGVTPTLAILRVGERPDDISYEKGARKRCESLGVAVRQVTLAADVTQEAFDRELITLNEDSAVHGILMFRPLPPQLDDERARQMALWQAYLQIQKMDFVLVRRRLPWRFWTIMGLNARAGMRWSSAGVWWSGVRRRCC